MTWDIVSNDQLQMLQNELFFDTGNTDNSRNISSENSSTQNEEKQRQQCYWWNSVNILTL